MSEIISTVRAKLPMSSVLAAASARGLRRSWPRTLGAVNTGAEYQCLCVGQPCALKPGTRDPNHGQQSDLSALFSSVF